MRYDVQFYGKVLYVPKDGGSTTLWQGGEVVQAVAYDHLVPGTKSYAVGPFCLVLTARMALSGDNTEQSVLALRLWGSRARGGMDMELFQAGEHDNGLQVLTCTLSKDRV